MDIWTAGWGIGGLRLSAAAGSVVGNRYRENYDVVHLDQGRPLAVVADGMGSGAGSTAAGRTAVETFVQHAQPGRLRSAVAEVQRAVIAKGRGVADLTGCTLTAFVGDDDGAWIVQLGDSRVYRLRDGVVELLTVDHTVAWHGLLHGWFTADSPEAHAARYRLLRYVGHPKAPEPDLLSISLRAQDRFLLCTDGVSDQLTYERLAEALNADAEPTVTVEALLKDTLVTGDDNATAILIQTRSA